MSKACGLKWCEIWKWSLVAEFHFAHLIQSVYNKDVIISSTESNPSHKQNGHNSRRNMETESNMTRTSNLSPNRSKYPAYQTLNSKTYMYLHTALVCATASFTFLPLFGSSPLITPPHPLRFLYLIPPLPSISHKWICTHAIQSFQVLRVIHTSLPPLLV